MTRTTRSTLISIVAVLFAALSLRIPTISLGPLLPNIRETTEYGESLLSLQTSIPLAMTLAIAPLSPWLAARIGRNRVISLALISITVGILLRSIPGEIPLLLGTLVLGFAIAAGTVLIPAAIAAEAPERRARLTGTYSMALSLGPALALGLTIPIMNITDFDWRGTLAVWATCGLLALLLWIFYVRFARPTSRPAKPEHTSPAITGSIPTSPDQSAKPSGVRGAVADLQVWQLALYLGITSVTFYTTSTWLPTTLVMDGMSSAAAGSYTAVINIVAIPFAFLPPIGMRHGYARIIAPLAPVGAILGVVLLLLSGASGALASVLLLGISQGLCLGVSYDQIVRYASSPEHAASVSAVTSAFGVALASVGPFAYGLGLEVTRSATISLWGLGLVVLLQMLLGFRTSKAVMQRE